MTDTARAFYALPLAPADLAPLVEAQGRMRRAAERSRLSPRWTRPDQLHLTLKFLGNVPRESLPALLEIGARRAASTPALRCRLSRVSAFASEQRARVLIALLEPHDQGLSALASALENDVAALGVPPETRAFVPHLTLGRLRHPTAVGPLIEAAHLEPRELALGELRLYESTLRPDGSEHHALGVFPLGA